MADLTISIVATSLFALLSITYAIRSVRDRPRAAPAHASPTAAACS